MEFIINPERKSSLRIGDMNFKHQNPDIQHQGERENKRMEFYRISEIRVLRKLKPEFEKQGSRTMGEDEREKM